MFLILFLLCFLTLFDKSSPGFISLAAHGRNVHIGSHLFYVMDEKLEHSCKEAIHESLQYLTDVSCLTFEEFENFTQNATGFRFESSNDVNGYISEENGLTVGKLLRIMVGHACGAKVFVLNCLRIILFALGFQFEHLRPDRQQFVDFNLTNVDPKFYRLFFHDYNLQLLMDEYKNVTPYDISSIMHFGAQEHCTYYDKPVFKAKNPLMQWSLGHNLKVQYDWMSFRDKLTLNYLMHCNDNCDRKSTAVNEPCLHNGYRDKLCSCVCPYGFSGDLCQFLKYHYRYNAPECGPVILSEKNAEDDDDRSVFILSSPNFPSQYPRNLFCQWYVETDRATEILKLTFNFLDLEYEKVVRTGEKCADKLYVFVHGTDVDTSQIPCQPKDNEKLVGYTFETQQNWLLVEFRTDPWGQHKHRGFNISIRVVDTMAESSTDVRTVIDMKIETILRNFTEFLTNQIAKNCLICYRCDNATHCERDAQNFVTCESGEACAYKINIDDELDWRGCSTMELCANGWRNSLLDVEGDNEYWDIFRCCGESYCNFIEPENYAISHSTQKLCLLLGVVFVLLFNAFN